MLFVSVLPLIYFNPRLSCERRQKSKRGNHEQKNFNPRLSCERRRYIKIIFQLTKEISIHASRVRGDFGYSTIGVKRNYISIHASRVRGDPVCIIGRVSRIKYFNPRLSCERRRLFYTIRF